MGRGELGMKARGPGFKTASAQIKAWRLVHLTPILKGMHILVVPGQGGEL